jgi:cleavage and polyadenylation specificity factor subunit 1
MAAAQATDPSLRGLRSNSSLQLQQLPLALSDGVTLLCDVSTGASRPVVPEDFRRPMFDVLHNMSHPGIRETQRLVRRHFVWPGVNSDVRKWARSCIQCQRSKIHRHTITPQATFATPDARFDRIHIDLVGPLPPSDGCVYLLTCVDRFTRWPEAIPIPDSTAETVAQAFVRTWVARFGIPTTVTTDRGPQFESHLWKAFTQLIGTKHIHTTAYHPCSNGMVERFHRQLKAALKAHPGTDRWTDTLPLALLGIRTSLKEDIGCTAAELVYGTSLRLPGGFFMPQVESDNTDLNTYVTRLKSMMQTVRAAPPRHPPSLRTHVHDDLSTASYVFVRHDAVRKPLQQPYDGPYKVLRRSEKYFTLECNGKQNTVSLDRLKPAHLDHCPPSYVTPRDTPTTAPPGNTPVSVVPVSSSHPQARTTRAGRQVHWPAHLTDFVP